MMFRPPKSHLFEIYKVIKYVLKCAENDVFLSVCDLLKCVLLSITRTLRVAMKERLHDVHWSNYKQKSSWIYNAMVCTLSIMQWECVLDDVWVVKFPHVGFKISSNSLLSKAY